MPDVFISYSHADAEAARAVEQRLKSFGLDVWRDERMSPGARFEPEIQERLRGSRVCLFLLSESFLASEYCQNEVGYAEAHGVRFLPCRLDDCRPKGFLASRKYFDARSSESRTFGLPWRVRALVNESLMVPLRAELLEFYARLLRLAGAGGEPPPVRVDVREAGGWTECSIEQSRETYAAVCEGVIDYLESGGALEGAFGNIWTGQGVDLPAWRLRSSAVDGLNDKTMFQSVPDLFLFGRTIRESGDIIEASVICTNLVGADDEEKYREKRQKDWADLDEEARDRLGEAERKAAHLRGLLPPVRCDHFGWNYGQSLVAAERGRVDVRDAELVLIPTKGVYRVGLFTDDYSTKGVVFTKYLGAEATRARLGVRAREGVAAPAGEAPRAGGAARPALELMYLGYESGYKERTGKSSFLLYNNGGGIAVVSSMDVVVRRVVHRGPQLNPYRGDGELFGIISVYRYKVALGLEDARVHVTEDNFKYAPGEVDRFSVELTGKSGYAYEFVIEVEWADISDGRLSTVSTPTEVATFPDYVNSMPGEGSE